MAILKNYLDINKLFDDKDYDSLIKNNLIKISNYGIDKYGEDEISHFTFKYNGEDYYFKVCDNFLIELATANFISKIGFDNLKYELACIDGVYGVVSKNFKKPNCNYVYGAKIIKDYYDYLKETDADFIEQMYYEKDRATNTSRVDFNNLEAIWQALEFRYKDYPNKNEIVSKVLLGLRDRFLLKSILLRDGDYYSYNWAVEEDGTNVNLTPIYDNEYSLDEFDYVAFGVNCDTVEEYFVNELDEYLKISSEEDIKVLDDIMSKATPKLFKECLYEVANKYGINNELEEICEDYRFGYDVAASILAERRNNGR